VVIRGGGCPCHAQRLGRRFMPTTSRSLGGSIKRASAGKPFLSCSSAHVGADMSSITRTCGEEFASNVGVQSLKPASSQIKYNTYFATKFLCSKSAFREKP
jgi:hypothetical protein